MAVVAPGLGTMWVWWLVYCPSLLGRGVVVLSGLQQVLRLLPMHGTHSF